MAFTTELHSAMPNPGKRKAQVNSLPHVRAARLRACGSGAAAAAAASEGGTAEVGIDDALALADEAQRQLEADAAEMNAEMNANLGDAQVVPHALPMPHANSFSDSPLPFPITDGRTTWTEDPWWRTDQRWIR